jgi:hypothetical protein
MHSTIKIKRISEGVAFLLPSQFHFGDIEITELTSPLLNASLIGLFWLYVMWTFFGVLWVEFPVYLASLIAGWGGLGIYGLCLVFYFLVDEQISITRTRLTTRKQLWGYPVSAANHYDLPQIHGLRHVSGMPSRRSYLLFDYQKQTIKFGITREEADALRLFQYLTDIRTWRCQTVTHIIFGAEVPSLETDANVFQNPDVTDLTTPFFHLKQICLMADSYNFQQVERFLTYAVNYLGQDYLKTHVAVHIYGDVQKIQSNLLNNFNYLCQYVHVHADLRY